MKFIDCSWRNWFVNCGQKLSTFYFSILERRRGSHFGDFFVKVKFWRKIQKITMASKHRVSWIGSYVKFNFGSTSPWSVQLWHYLSQSTFESGMHMILRTGKNLKSRKSNLCPSMFGGLGLSSMLQSYLTRIASTRSRRRRQVFTPPFRQTFSPGEKVEQVRRSRVWWE
jgi:hypothetical protein